MDKAKASVFRFSNNRFNGWHWSIDLPYYAISNFKPYTSKKNAVRAMRMVAKKYKITISEVK